MDDLGIHVLWNTNLCNESVQGTQWNFGMGNTDKMAHNLCLEARRKNSPMYEI